MELTCQGHTVTGLPSFLEFSAKTKSHIVSNFWCGGANSLHNCVVRKITFAGVKGPWCEFWLRDLSKFPASLGLDSLNSQGKQKQSNCQGCCEALRQHPCHLALEDTVPLLFPSPSGMLGLFTAATQPVSGALDTHGPHLLPSEGSLVQL